MQKNVNKHEVETVLLTNPEASLEVDNLSYQSAELQEIIQHFTRAANFRDIHRFVLDLLQATANFRYATVPNGVFFTVRNKKKTDSELNMMLTTMQQAVKQARGRLQQGKLDHNDKRILSRALDYAQKSLLNRVQSWQPGDRLLPLWQGSELKQLLGA